MGDTHNPVERALRRDISGHNGLRRQAVDLERRISRWADRAEGCKNKRRRKRLEASIERTRPTLAGLRERLQARGTELRNRIVTELKFSEGEVNAFQEKFRKEHAEYVKAAQAAGKARRAADKIEKEAPVETANKVLRRLGRAERKARGEGKDVKAVERELTSEARDRAFFEDALHRLLTDPS